MGGNNAATLAARRVHYLEAESGRISPSRPSFHVLFLDYVAKIIKEKITLITIHEMLNKSTLY